MREKEGVSVAYYYDEPSHTFGEYLLVPGYSSEHCVPANVSLRTPLVKYKKGPDDSSVLFAVLLLKKVSGNLGWSPEISCS